MPRDPNQNPDLEDDERGEVVDLTEVPAADKKPPPKKVIEDDQREDDDQEEQDDERLDLGTQVQTPEEREALRERRRRRRHKASVRRREEAQELDNLRTEVLSLRDRVANTEAGASRATLMNLQQQKNRLQEYIQEAEAIHSHAVDKRDGPEMLKAQRAIAEAERRIKLIEDFERNRGRQDDGNGRTSSGQDGTSRRQAQPQVDPRIVRAAQNFQKEHPWYQPADPKPSAETLVVAALDARIFQEGFDPLTDDYWDELKDRVRKALPTMFDEDDGDGDDDDGDERVPNSLARRPVAARRRGPPVGGSNGQRRLNPGEVFVPAIVKKAIQDAGYWDDPKERKDALRRFQESQRRQSQQARR